MGVVQLVTCFFCNNEKTIFSPHQGAAINHVKFQKSAMLHSVFTYGTLQIPAIMAAVTGVQPEFDEAILPGHTCYRMKHRVYPGAVPCIGRYISGRLYLGIDDARLKYLDVFEDILYERQLLTVMTRNTTVKAQVYIVARKYRKLLLPEPWDIEEFKSKHLARYHISCRKFHQRITGSGKPSGCQEACVK